MAMFTGAVGIVLRSNLNRLQRGLLLIVAAGILIATFAQESNFGFDGVEWLVSVAISVGLAFIAISTSSNRADARPILNKEPKSKALSFDSNDPQKLIDAMSVCSSAILPVMPSRLPDSIQLAEGPARTAMAKSSFAIRLAVYCYVVVVVAAIRTNPDFMSGKSFTHLTLVFYGVFENGWRKRFGDNIATAPNDDGEPWLEDSFDSTLVLTQVTQRMIDRSDAPFEPLFRYIETDSRLTLKQLEAKYGATTSSLLEKILGRVK